MTTPKNNPENEFHAPRELAEGLARLHGASPAVPPEMDAAVLAMARRHFARRRAARLVVRWASAVAAAAAAVVIAWAATRSGNHAAMPAAGQGSAKSLAMKAPAIGLDVDSSGAVNILDAFALARRTQAGAVTKSEWDVNGDGAVDRRDVDAIAMAAVSLRRGGSRR